MEQHLAVFLIICFMITLIYFQGKGLMETFWLDSRVDMSAVNDSMVCKWVPKKKKSRRGSAIGTDSSADLTSTTGNSQFLDNNTGGTENTSSDCESSRLASHREENPSDEVKRQKPDNKKIEGAPTANSAGMDQSTPLSNQINSQPESTMEEHSSSNKTPHLNNTNASDLISSVDSSVSETKFMLEKQSSSDQTIHENNNGSDQPSLMVDSSKSVTNSTLVSNPTLAQHFPVMDNNNSDSVLDANNKLAQTCISVDRSTGDTNAPDKHSAFVQASDAIFVNYDNTDVTSLSQSVFSLTQAKTLPVIAVTKSQIEHLPDTYSTFIHTKTEQLKSNSSSVQADANMDLGTNNKSASDSFSVDVTQSAKVGNDQTKANSTGDTECILLTAQTNEKPYANNKHAGCKITNSVEGNTASAQTSLNEWLCTSPTNERFNEESQTTPVSSLYGTKPDLNKSKINVTSSQTQVTMVDETQMSFKHAVTSSNCSNKKPEQGSGLDLKSLCRQQNVLKYLVKEDPVPIPSIATIDLPDKNSVQDSTLPSEIV